MKYRLTALLLCALFLAAVLWGCGDTADSTQTQPDTIPSGAVTDVTNVESSVSTPDESGADIASIEGFTPEYTPNGELSALAITDAPVVLSSVGSYFGKYVEDGSDEAVENICAVVIKNTGDKPIQYATVNLTAEDGTEYCFVLSTLPAGCSALVLESEKKAYTQTLAECTISADVTQCEELVLEEEKVRVTFNGELLRLKNLTDTDFRAVYVRYKNYTAGNVYLGGITYNATFESVTAGGSSEYDSTHFYTGGSQVLMIQIVE